MPLSSLLVLTLVAAPQVRPALIFDGHNDLSWKVREQHGGAVEAVDFRRDTATLPFPLHTDIPRLRAGRVGAQLWAANVPTSVTGPRVVEVTLELLDILRRLIAANPGDLELATSVVDVRRVMAAGKIASLLSVEGGHQIDGRLAVLRVYRALGVTSMTLVHSTSSAWANAATDAPRVPGGLSPFGKQVVQEMNRLAMVIDLSHSADDTVSAVLAESAAPVIASHSNARALADHPRNLPDALIRAIAAKGGVVMVTFWPAFVSRDWAAWDKARSEFARTAGVRSEIYGPRAPAPLVAWESSHPHPRVTLSQIADHVEHVARVAGRTAVGLGGGYDNAQHVAPDDMPGVDTYPALLAELARRGWSEAELADLGSGNILRVFSRVEAVATERTAQRPVEGIDAASR